MVTHNVQELAEVLRKQFTEAELHDVIITADHPNNRGMAHWDLLARASVLAADCRECALARVGGA